MNIINTVNMAVKSILSNKMRTFLTMLGIIIGVFSVIVLISISEGSSKAILDNIENMGSNMINVYIYEKNKVMDYDKIMELSDLDGVNCVTPKLNQAVMVKYDMKSDNINVEGANEFYADINDYKIAEGRNISPVDVDFRNKVAVIGSKTSDDFFKGDDPLNKEISINGEKYKVVGIFESKKNTMYGDSNKIIIIPVTTAMRQFKVNFIDSILLKSFSSDTSKTAAAEVRTYLKKYFGKDESFNVYSQDEMLDTINESNKTMTMTLGGIACISLLVGGIGIMNIMLVTVTERTREIGIRKAIGAGRTNIMIQFIVESSVISSIGGLIGIFAGSTAAKIISGMMDIKYAQNADVILAAMIFSMLIGVFFGIYPASKASKLKPIDALSFE